MSQVVTDTLSRANARDNHYLELVDLTKRYGSVVVLDQLNASIGQGEFVSLLGPSGCGKTTLLRLIAGLLTPEAGFLRLNGRDLNQVPAHKRNIGVVFQSYALFPHLNVAENVAFGLEAQGAPKDAIKQRVVDALSLVRMKDFSNRRISELSGGQQQRIAVARALAVRPSLLLLDEPFSALDRNLRETMQIELRDLLRRQDITAIFVTHDQDEALVMSDRIAVMNSGRIEQFGTPTEIYRHPKTTFVLDFVGQSTKLNGIVVECSNGRITASTSIGPISAFGTKAVGTPITVGVRPELIDLSETSKGLRDINEVDLTLGDTVYLGSKTMLYFKTPSSEDRFLVEVPRLIESAPAGTLMKLHWSIADTIIFS
jgi:putative spermidine/putrescine transport system ATP-binding protein